MFSITTQISNVFADLENSNYKVSFKNSKLRKGTFILCMDIVFSRQSYRETPKDEKPTHAVCIRGHRRNGCHPYSWLEVGYYQFDCW